jgi:hypothetical protein
MQGSGEAGKLAGRPRRKREDNIKINLTEQGGTK